MAGRKKPNSGKAKKSQLIEQRARKAAKHQPTHHPLDLAQQQQLPTTAGAPPVQSSRPSGLHRRPQDPAVATRREGKLNLESRFLRLPLELLQHHRRVSSTASLPRPIDPSLALLQTSDLQPPELEGLTCPSRPKWSYHSTKKEVERNEEGVFAKWLTSTDAILARYASSLPNVPTPTFFERNLMVWRQLWRVCEASEILLILLDVRIPLLHYPPALANYIKALRPKKKIILVLTKTDLVPRSLAEAWQKYFEEREGTEGAAVVLMESYRASERSVLSQGTQPRFVPSAPSSSRSALLTGLRKAHAELLTPPPVVAKDPARLDKWDPRIRREVDWESVEAPPAAEEHERERKARRGKTEAYVPRRKRKQGVCEEEVPGDEESLVVDEEKVGEKLGGELTGDDVHPFVTVGLIGQPNVGKSSLLNALLGRKVVRASRTPGKTKTLQTIFWNRTIRLCDCPGLVCPSFAGMERQVLSGILPIQNVEPVLYYIAQRMPLENILRLGPTSSRDEFKVDSKRDGPEVRTWTADDILTEYAEAQHFITAKAGRPDLYRAGAFILRQLHSSAIPWAFRPPFVGDPTDFSDQEGIWIPGFVPKTSTIREEMREAGLVDEVTEEEDSGSGESDEEEEDESREESEEESEIESGRGRASSLASAFASLEVEGDVEESDGEDHR